MSTQTFRVRSAEDLGRVLREARLNHGLTQAEAVEQLGATYDRTRLARMEAGGGLQSFSRMIHALRRLGVEVTATMTVSETQS